MLSFRFRAPAFGRVAAYRGLAPGDRVRIPGSMPGAARRVERLARRSPGGPVMAWLVGGGGEPVEARVPRKAK